MFDEAREGVRDAARRRERMTDDDATIMLAMLDALEAAELCRESFWSTTARALFASRLAHVRSLLDTGEPT
jgi:hypothetical protein